VNIPSLNIVGCGRLGRTLGRLWHEAGVFRVQDILTRSLPGACHAAGFIGSGRPVGRMEDLRCADVWLVATGDSEIESCCAHLAAARLFSAGNTVLHCSGALSSEALRAAANAGAATASMHPIKSFADPARTAATFAGTWVGAEGHAEALALLEPAFTRIGARVVAIEAEHKRIYHAASVFASNYLVTLLDVARQAYIKAGVPPETAMQVMEPLVRGSVDNVFALGTEQALTGPVARGDVATVVSQYRAVKQWDRRCGALYKQLAKLTRDLAARAKHKR